MNALIAYDWPGNIRELENIIERSVILSRGNHLALEKIAFESSSQADREQILTLSENERRLIIRTLEAANWQLGGEHGAAKLLGIPRTTLQSRMKKLGITRS